MLWSTPGRGVDHEDHHVGHGHRRPLLPGEVERSRSVEQVDLVLVPLEGREREHLRTAGGLLLRLVVTDGVLRLDAPHAIQNTGPVEHRLGQHGLPPRRFEPTSATLRMRSVGYVFTDTPSFELNQHVRCRPAVAAGATVDAAETTETPRPGQAPLACGLSAGQETAASGLPIQA